MHTGDIPSELAYVSKLTMVTEQNTVAGSFPMPVGLTNQRGLSFSGRGCLNGASRQRVCQGAAAIDSMRKIYRKRF